MKTFKSCFFIDTLLLVLISASCQKCSPDGVQKQSDNNEQNKNSCRSIVVNNSLYTEYLNDSVSSSLNIYTSRTEIFKRLQGVKDLEKNFPDSVNVRDGCLHILISDTKDWDGKYTLVWDGNINRSDSLPHVNLFLHRGVVYFEDLVGITSTLHYDLSTVRKNISGHKLILNLQANTDDHFVYRIEYNF